MCDWVLDTSLLYEAAKGDMDASDVLYGIKYVKHRIVVDHERHIEGEYQRCIYIIKRKTKEYLHCEFVSHWLKIMYEKKRIYYHCGKLNNKHQDKLMGLKFHKDDWPFVAVCFCSINKRLVAEESDYSREVIDYLKKQMNIVVMKTKDCLQIIEKY